ncbi:unnamed protein product [Cochlearia groenlandica]
MYTKRLLFLRANLTLSLPNKCFSSPESVRRIHRFMRNHLCTAIERLDFANPNGERANDSSNCVSDINPREGFKGISENREHQGSSVVQTQSHSYGSNPSSDSTWHNLSYRTSSVYRRNGGSSWHSGNETSDFDINGEVEDFDAYCRQENLKLALRSVESLEKMGCVFDLARLLILVKLCCQGNAFLEAKALEEAKATVQGKIRALVCNLDANYLRYYTDLVVEEFDVFCRQGNVKKALYTIETLACLSHVMDLDRLLRLAKLCGEAEILQEAKVVHGKISSLGYHLDASSNHVLIEMYSNCGSIDEALNVFEKMHEKNLETWYIMIRCLAKKGLGEEAIDMFTRFKKEGNKPDNLLFRGVFYTCGLLGDVDEGLLHFSSMFKDYGIIPTMEDYVSIIEMFALPGFLDEALEFLERMPMPPNADAWETLMNLSRVHGDLELGDRCAEMVQELDPTRLTKQSREGFLPVKASDVEKESLKKKSGVHALSGIKCPKVCEYRAGDANLPENDELLEILRNLKTHMVEMGYVPLTKVVLHDIDEESKETALLGHSERIAFARAALNSAPRSTFTVIKNLRVCVDCHEAWKIMSVIVGRDIVMRDAKRFHHIKNGVCSCNNYW